MNLKKKVKKLYVKLCFIFSLAMKVCAFAQRWRTRIFLASMNWNSDFFTMAMMA